MPKLTYTAKEVSELILSGIERQPFYVWYEGGRFDDYITGVDPSITKEQILKDIEALFRL